MNKIEVVSNNLISNDAGDIISTYVNNDILTIDCKSDIKLIFINNIYKDVVINVLDNVALNILEIKKEDSLDSNYKYILNENSKVIINKFYYSGEYSENVNIDLNGYNSDATFNLSVASFGNQKYNINIYHNNKKTISNVFNHGITFGDSVIDFIINGTVKKGMNDSILNQDNKIMIMGNGKSSIEPNLFIEDDVIEARHGASIGKFSEEELFYLETRGISREIGYELLIKGFLLNHLIIEDDVLEELEGIVCSLRR